MNALFYFGNSPAGGGIVRLRGLYQHSQSSKSIFIGHESSRDEFEDKPGFSFVNPRYILRILDENHYIRPFLKNCDVVFSHGAPLVLKNKKVVLHLNNALPLVYDKVTLDKFSKVKFRILEAALRKSAQSAQLVTVESHATAELVKNRWGNDVFNKCKILPNGVDPVEIIKGPLAGVTPPYAITVGTYSYKRLELVEKCFNRLKEETPNLQLIVIGTVPKKMPPGNYRYYESVPYSTLRSLIANCSSYITMSEIENSSIALLEAIFHKRRIICSAIPSHLEALGKFNYENLEFSRSVVDSSPPESEITMTTWQEVTELTYQLLKEIGIFQS
jgi:glycosyltransferase involved in cell wall biosynthesis